MNPVPAAAAAIEQATLRDIADRSFTLVDIAQVYALARESAESTALDWPRIRAAIERRFGTKGLIDCQRLATTGKCFSGEPEDERRKENAA